jgi:hypothetical protein
MDISCRICCNSYDDHDNAPRILGNCGHTLCTACIMNSLKTLRESFPGQKHLFLKCPFDKVEQLINEKTTHESFPKNFELLELITEGPQRKVSQSHRSLSHHFLEKKVTDKSSNQNPLTKPYSRVRDFFMPDFESTPTEIKAVIAPLSNRNISNPESLQSRQSMPSSFQENFNKSHSVTNNQVPFNSLNSKLASDFSEFNNMPNQYIPIMPIHKEDANSQPTSKFPHKIKEDESFNNKSYFRFQTTPAIFDSTLTLHPELNSCALDLRRQNIQFNDSRNDKKQPITDYGNKNQILSFANGSINSKGLSAFNVKEALGSSDRDLQGLNYLNPRSQVSEGRPAAPLLLQHTISTPESNQRFSVPLNFSPFARANDINIKGNHTQDDKSFFQDKKYEQLVRIKEENSVMGITSIHQGIQNDPFFNFSEEILNPSSDQQLENNSGLSDYFQNSKNFTGQMKFPNDQRTASKNLNQTTANPLRYTVPALSHPFDNNEQISDSNEDIRGGLLALQKFKSEFNVSKQDVTVNGGGKISSPNYENPTPLKPKFNQLLGLEGDLTGKPNSNLNGHNADLRFQKNLSQASINRDLPNMRIISNPSYFAQQLNGHNKNSSNNGIVIHDSENYLEDDSALPKIVPEFKKFISHGPSIGKEPKSKENPLKYSIQRFDPEPTADKKDRGLQNNDFIANLKQ